jgi:hypothetical protein
MTTRSFLPEWLTPTKQPPPASTSQKKQPKSETPTESVKRRRTATDTNKRSTTPTAVKNEPLPVNPQLQEALLQLKKEKLTAEPKKQKPKQPLQTPEAPPSAAVGAEDELDPEVIVNRLIGNGLEPLDAEVPALRRKSHLQRPAANLSSPSRHTPPVIRISSESKSRKRSLAAKYNDPTPSFVDSQDDVARFGGKTTPSPGRKMFRKASVARVVDDFVQLDDFEEAEEFVEEEVVEGEVRDEAVEEQHSSSSTSSSGAAELSLPTPESEPVVVVERSLRSSDQPISIVAAVAEASSSASSFKPFYRFAPAQVRDDDVSEASLQSPILLSSSSSSSPAPRSSSSALPPLPPPTTTADDESEPFTRFDPEFLRADYLP